jgi:hypothetical protein
VACTELKLDLQTSFDLMRYYSLLCPVDENFSFPSKMVSYGARVRGRDRLAKRVQSHTAFQLHWMVTMANLWAGYDSPSH